MENLINKNISLQNKGLDELEGWIKMLSDVQKKLIKAYNLRCSELAEQHQKDIDFIQKQIIRLNNRG
jgi:hypothetical protein